MTNPADDDFDAQDVQRVAERLVDGLGCRQALERTRRQERVGRTNPSLAKAVRLEVERICKGRSDDI